jgi:hypothetical protein
MSQDSVPASRGWYRQPIWLGLLGLALMVGGWKLTTFVPPSPEEQSSAERLAELRKMAGEREDGLAERLDQIARDRWREPPFRVAGRLAFLTGLALFVTAGVLMSRSPARDESALAEEARRGEDQEETSATGR